MSENENVGHGHVFPRPDGMKARCGGPGLCPECNRDRLEAKKSISTKTINSITTEDVQSFNVINEIQPVNSLDYYQNIATKSANYPGKGSALGLVYLALKLNGEAGEAAEQVGKAMRDDELVTVNRFEGIPSVNVINNRELSHERRAAIIRELGDNLWYLGAICNELGTTLSEVAATNLKKLADRTARNTLQGDGDNR